MALPDVPVQKSFPQFMEYLNVGQNLRKQIYRFFVYYLSHSSENADMRTGRSETDIDYPQLC